MPKISRRILPTMLIFVALASLCCAQSLRLTWDDNTEADLSHYNVYRAEVFGGPFEQLGATSVTIPLAWVADEGPEPTVTSATVVLFTAVAGAKVTASEYVDTTAKFGRLYWYVVTAVDTSWNESIPSNRAGRLNLEKIPPGQAKKLR